MTRTISSAQPISLYRYANTGFYINSELVAEANHLASVLYHFESTCTEYRVHVSYLADDLRRYARHVEDIDRWVKDIGIRFERADRRSWFDRLCDFIDKYSKEKKQWEIWQSILSGTVIMRSIHLGSAYSGEVIIDLPDYLKFFGFSLRKIREWAGLSPYLTHIKFTHIPSHFAKIGVIASIPIIAYKWARDVGKYSGSKLASALTVDAGLTLGTNVAAVWAGAKLGAIAGAKIGALIGTGAEPGGGTAIGGAVGAIVGGIAGGIIAGLAIDHYDVREKSISWLDEHVFSPLARTIAKGVDAVDSWVDDAARRMQQQFDEIERTAQLKAARFQRDVSRGAQDVVQTIGNLGQNAGQTIKDRFHQIWQGGAKLLGKVDTAVGNIGHGLDILNGGLNVANWIKPNRFNYALADVGALGVGLEGYQWLRFQHSQKKADEALERWRELRHTPYDEGAWRKYVVTRLKTVPGLGDIAAMLYSIVEPPAVYGDRSQISGEILGAHTHVGRRQTDELFSQDISSLPWSELPEYKAKLSKEVASRQAEVNALDDEIKSIKTGIADIEAEKQKLIDERQKLENHRGFFDAILPSEKGLKFGRPDDGFPDAPYRTRADDIEDRIAEIDRKVAQLEEKKATMQQDLDSYSEQLGKQQTDLQKTQSKLNELSRRLETGLGKAKPEDFDSKVGCVRYAKKRRPDLKKFKVGGPQDFIEKFEKELHPYMIKANKGFHLEDHIVKGNALVWPRHRKDLGRAGSPGYTYGHIAIVEEVGRDENGEYVIVSQAGVGIKKELTTYPTWSTRMKIYKKNLDGLYII